MTSPKPASELPSREVRLGPRRWLEPLVLFALPCLLYLPSLDYGLLGYDDDLYYLVNPALRDGVRGLGAIFTGSFFSDYMPATQLTWWLDASVFGLESFRGARLHGLAWFGAAVLGVRALVRRVTGRRDVALAVALLFALHPVASHSILWLAQRKNLVALAFALWSAERYVAAREGETAAQRRAPALAAGALAVAALLAKAHAVTLPALLAAYELARGRGPWRRRLAWLSPFAGAAAVFGAANLLWLRADLAGEPLAGSRLAGLAASGPILLRYLRQALLPVDLSFLYAVNEQPGALALGAWLLLVAFAAASLRIARDPRAVAWAWLFAVAALLPALNLVPQPQPMADQYNLWALPGWLCVAVLLTDRLLIARLPHPRAAAAVVCTAVALFFAVQSLRRTPEYASPHALFAATVRHEPTSALAWSEHARTLLAGRDETDRARGAEAARRALEQADAHRILGPERAVLAKESAVALHAAGQTERARAWLDAELSPLAEEHAPLATLARAEFALRTGAPERAALLLAPARAELPEVAIRELRSRCRSGETLPDELPPVAQLSLASGDAADRDFNRRALLQRLHLLSAAYFESGRLEDAFDLAAVLVNTAPDYAPGRALLAETYRKLGLADAARGLGAKERASNRP